MGDILWVVRVCGKRWYIRFFLKFMGKFINKLFFCFIKNNRVCFCFFCSLILGLYVVIMFFNFVFMFRSESESKY